MKISIATLAMALIAMTAIASAQQGEGFGPPPGGPGGGQGPGMRGMGGPGGGMQMGGPQLLLRPEVVKELKLTDDQIDQIQQAMPQRMRRGPGGQGGPGQGGQGGQGGFGGPPPDRNGNGQPPQGGPNQGQKMDKVIKGILNQAQYTRFKQIEYQAQGAVVIERPEVAQALDLSDDQMNQIDKIVEASRSMRGGPGGPGRGGPGQGGFGQGGQGQGGQGRGGEGQGGFGGPPPDRDAMRKQMEDQRAKTNNQILAVLTSEQKAAWTAMLGKPFKLEMGPPQGGPGGRGGPGGPGGPGQRGGGGGFGQ